jgi:hypothetical protein
VFLTGFLIFFLSPEYGAGFLHATEGWLFFVVSFVALGLVARLMLAVERRIAGESEYA